MSWIIAMGEDKELIKIPMPVPGIEYVRKPSPPPSEHSSQDENELQNDKKKKQRKTVEEYIKLRNETYKAYLKKLEKKPPKTYCLEAAILQKKINSNVRLSFGQMQRRPYPDDVSVNFSDTSCETDCSIPRNQGRARNSFRAECENAVVIHLKQQSILNGDMLSGVLFSHTNFQLILEAKWKLIKITRLEQILEGVMLDCTVDSKWLDFETNIQKYYGPMDTDSEHYKELFVAFQMQRWEMIIEMFEEETKMMEKMLEEKKVPSDFPDQLAALRETRFRLEISIASMTEAYCDQNPYTNPDNMDFWVMPRPKQSIKVYGIRNEEMEDFLEFQLSVNEKEDQQQVMALLENQKLFVREGYNPAVFDVGWTYSVEKIYGDVPWKEFFPDDLGDFARGSQRENEKYWGNHLLILRGDLMKFNPFGVQDTYFLDFIKKKYGFPEDDSVLGNYENAVEYLSDFAFSQKLTSSSDIVGGGDTEVKNILFDSLFEGVIVTPAEMLVRVRTRIRYLIDEQPNHLLPLSELQKSYEDCFDQKFFPLQWGYKDMEDFLEKEILDEDLIIVEKDEKEIKAEQANKASKIQKEIDAKWASVVENGDDEDDNELFSDLFEELIHEGPWVSEGEVYRVLDG